MNRKDHLKTVKRIVVKVGTAILTRNGLSLNTQRIRHLVEQIVQLHAEHYQVVLVSSGAITVGANRLGYNHRPTRLVSQQAAAAVGQGMLMHTYERLFRNKGLVSGQILLTREDLEQRKRYVNAKNTLEEMLRLNVVPIINENDTVAVDEIKFGDNDTLAALCTHLIHADLLVILSDIEGLMTGDPRQKKQRCVNIPVVMRVDKHIEMISEGTRAYQGVGGIRTKIDAAKIVVQSGETMVLADGKKKHVLCDIMNGKEIGTIFYPAGHKVKQKKRWISFLKNVQGVLVIDEGALHALLDGKGRSLLASGVIDVKNEFKKGAVVDIIVANGCIVGRGLVRFSSKDLMKIKGKRTQEIEEMMGPCAATEVIHRNEMVMFYTQRAK